MVTLIRPQETLSVMSDGPVMFHNDCVYAVIISKYATKIVGTQKRKVACVHGKQDQKQSIFNTFKPAQ